MKGLVAVGIGGGKQPSHISQAITGFDSFGSGKITKFRVNGKIVKKSLTYKKHLKLERNVGLFADGKVIKKFKKGDTWSIETMNAKVCMNQVDAALAFKIWSEDNPGKEFKDMPTS